MDFTFLFIVVLMVLAMQSNNLVITVALFALLLITAAKNKYLLFAAIIGGALSLVWGSDFAGEYRTPLLLGGLFAILLLLAKKDSDSPQPAAGMGGYY
ncbi:MAG: hypothetical protein V1708_04220 [Candidatus Micrarchaeota archaeon]